MQGELIGERLAGRDRFLADIRHAVHPIRDLQTMPMHGCWLRQSILEKNAHPVPLIRLDGRPRTNAVVSPSLDHPSWHQLAFYRLCDEVEYLDVTLHGE